MYHCKAYMYINFQQNWVCRSIKTVNTNLLAKQRKLHKFATCNTKIEKSRLYLHIRHIRPIFGSIGLLDIKLPRKQIIYTDDGWTDSNRFSKKEKNTKKHVNTMITCI